MGKISVFNFVTLDGFFAGPDGQIDWFKSIGKDEGFEKYTHSESGKGGSLIYGRKTYEMMKSFWPTDAARKADPHMADTVNNSEKIVFSKSLTNAEEGPHWKNIRIYSEIDKQEFIRLKEKRDMTILGSGTIVQQMTDLGLIDDYTFVVVPVILGKGKTMFEDAKSVGLKLLESRTFNNGLVMLRYGRK